MVHQQVPLAYHPDFAGTVNYDFQGMPDDPDAQVSQTMDVIRGFIRADAPSDLIGQHAARALQLGAGPGRSYEQQAILGVWQLVKANMLFKHDEELARALNIDDPRIPDVVEVVVRPIDMAMMIDRTGKGREDCDGFEGYAGCLLTRLGIPAALVTVSAHPERPREYSHVYMAAYPGGQRIALDFSHGPQPGWECPNTGRLKEWPIHETIADQLINALFPVALVVGVYLAYSYATEEA